MMAGSIERSRIRQINRVRDVTRKIYEPALFRIASITEQLDRVIDKL